ncbi:MAG: lipocalin family protein [Candidatus Bipolaricaulis sp.]|nr:lipocalin family protein [Candidatus Bipolaricaulis sp.]
MRIVWGILGLITLAAIGFASTQREVPAPVAKVDVDRYMGLWYTVASIPTSFERDCAQGTTAHYQRLANGRVLVTNTCYREDGTPIRVVGEAWIPDGDQSGKLKVSFVKALGLWLFGGDYWILDLAPDYTYAVVGHPQRRYGWILSRTPTLPDDVLAGIYDRLEGVGYSRNVFRSIDQTMHLAKRLRPGG